MQKTTTKTKRAARRAAASLALATLILPAAATVGGATNAVATQQETPAVSIVAKQGADAANAFAEALAAWQLEALSGGASTQALRELRIQMQRAVKEAPGDAGLADVLVDAEAAWVARIAAAGESSEREAALASLAAAVSIASGDGEADPLTAARARAAERPGVAALLAARAEARSANEPMTPAQTDVALSRAIDTALASGDMGFIGGLGSLAVEPLRQLALSSNGSPRASGALSPLQALLDVDVRAGLDVADTLVGSGDLLLKREVAAALRAAKAFEDDRAWTVRLEEPDVIGKEAWLDLVLGLTEEPSVAVSSLRSVLGDVLQRAALPERLWPIAFEARATGGGDKTHHPAMSGYFALFLEAEEPDLVGVGIDHFIRMEDASPLYALVDSRLGQQHLFRMWSVFGERRVIQWAPGQERADWSPIVPAIDAAYIDAFRRAIGAHPEQTEMLLNNATRATAAHPTRTLPVDVLLEAGAILRDSEEQNWFTVFWYLIQCEGDTERDLAIAAVREAIDAGMNDETIADTLGALADENAETATYWAAREVIDARLAPSWKLDRSRVDSSLDVLWRDPDKLDRVVDFMDEIAADPGRANAMNGRSFASKLARFLADRAPGRAPEILTRASAWPGVDALYAVEHRNNRAIEGKRAHAVCIAVLAAPRTTPQNRDAACNILRVDDVVLEDARAIEQAVVDVIARGEDLGPSQRDLTLIGVHWPRVIAGLLDRDGVPADRILPLRIFDLDAELAERVLRRFPASSITEGVPHDLVEGAAVTVLKSDVPGRVETLSPYVEASDEVAEQILRSFAYNPDPATLPLVREAAERTSLGDDWFERLAGAISGLMTDESAALLLDLGRRPNLAPEKRRAAMEQFETMLQWREAAARWERSSGAVARRDEAIAKLVELLDGDDATTAQRVEAVRGLGLLGAAEELPRLIGLLDDVQLRAAAQEAIDALHAAEARDDGEK